MDGLRTREELRVLLGALPDDQVEAVKLFVEALLDPGGPNQLVHYMVTMSEHDRRIVEELARMDLELGVPVDLDE